MDEDEIIMSLCIIKLQALFEETEKGDGAKESGFGVPECFLCLIEFTKPLNLWLCHIEFVFHHIL